MLTGLFYAKGQPLVAFAEAKEIEPFLRRKDGTLWLDLEAPSDAETAVLEGVFKFHPLLVQECLRFADRPKVDFAPECVYAIIHAPVYREKSGWLGVETAEIDVFVGEGFVVTYHPYAVEAINTLRDRCKTGAERYLGRGGDFLLYYLAETIVDNFFAVIDHLETRIELLEKDIFGRATAQSFRKIIYLKRDLMHLRRILGPQREVFSLLSREETKYITPPAQRYLRAAYDHVTIIHDVIDIDRDMVAGLRDTYLSYISNRLAETMKFLTIITTCLMPATILAGAWGMNFDYLPLRSWPLAFPLFFVACGLVAWGMVRYFQWKRWL